MKSKKGIFFTIIAIALLSLFVLIYTTYSVFNERKEIDKRVETMNNFVFSLQEDISRQVYISGYRAVLSIESYITSEGSFIQDSKQAIKEALLNATINNQPAKLMEGYKLEDWNTRVSELSSRMNLVTNYSVQEISVSQEDSWNIKIEIKIALDIQDKNEIASWTKTENISTLIEIDGFEDPLYLMNTNGKVVNKVKKSSYSFPLNDVSNLTLYVTNSSYISYSGGPSFLDRLEGKTTSNENGIESLVYLPELSEQGIAVKDKSVVDYIYFSQENPASHNIVGMPSWFKLDDAHLSVYNVTASS